MSKDFEIDIKEIERSIIKKYRKEIWAKFTKAIKMYELVNEGDKIYSIHFSFFPRF